MKKQKFREMLKQLHNELEGIHSIDDSGRELLRILMKDIQQILDQSTEGQSSQHNKLIKQLTEAIDYFEESHPVLVLRIKKMIDTLSNMGI